MSANASASATITATFAPVAGTPTYFAIELVYSASGSVVALTPYLHVYDGTLPPGTAGSNSNSAKKIKLAAADGVTPLIFDQDNFLTNYRVPRS
jgi:hypothetical protein